ncbi:hypothetical protein C0991_006817 [Blastosporella zonata]|nr:hypothetical protein C0991_006817 [Blastosporella zonata]
MILYVRRNEETSCVKMVYFNDGEKGVPSELEANAKKAKNPQLEKDDNDIVPTYVAEQGISQVEEGGSRWIAIEPPQSRHAAHSDYAYPGPPSFRDSQFDVVLRRQRLRPKEGGGRKLAALPSRFLHLPNEFEFAGWGSMTRVTLTGDDQRAGENRLQEIRRQRVLGQFTASALAGNAVLGSVFYALPAVVAVSNV